MVFCVGLKTSLIPTQPNKEIVAEALWKQERKSFTNEKKRLLVFLTPILYYLSYNVVVSDKA